MLGTKIILQSIPSPSLLITHRLSPYITHRKVKIVCNSYSGITSNLLKCCTRTEHRTEGSCYSSENGLVGEGRACVETQGPEFGPLASV